MAIQGQQGTILKYATTAVGSSVELDGPELTRKEVETSTLSTTVAKTYRPPALYDPGEISGKCLVDPGDASFVHFQTGIAAATVETWSLLYPDGTGASASGFLTKFKMLDKAEKSDDGLAEAAFTIKLSGAITFDNTP